MRSAGQICAKLLTDIRDGLGFPMLVATPQGKKSLPSGSASPIFRRWQKRCNRKAAPLCWKATTTKARCSLKPLSTAIVLHRHPRRQQRSGPAANGNCQRFGSLRLPFEVPARPVAQSNADRLSGFGHLRHPRRMRESVSHPRIPCMHALTSSNPTGASL